MLRVDCSCDRDWKSSAVRCCCRPDSLKTETVTTRILDDLQKQGVIYLYVLIYEGYIYGIYVLFRNFQ